MLLASRWMAMFLLIEQAAKNTQLQGIYSVLTLELDTIHFNKYICSVNNQKYQ